MSDLPPTASYETPPPPPPPHRRSIGTWMLLLAVWSIGLVFWGIYLLVAIYLFSRIV